MVGGIYLVGPADSRNHEAIMEKESLRIIYNWRMLLCMSNQHHNCNSFQGKETAGLKMIEDFGCFCLTLTMKERESKTQATTTISNKLCASICLPSSVLKSLKET